MQRCSTFLKCSHGSKTIQMTNTAQFQHFDRGPVTILIKSSNFRVGIEQPEAALRLFATHDPLCYNASDAGHGAAW
jgi:hypothetical protein